MREIVLEDQHTGLDLEKNDLLHLLMTHIYQFHHDNVEVLNFWDKVKQKYNFNQKDWHNIPNAMINDSCSAQSGHVMSIEGICVPNQICNYANDILLELKQTRNNITCSKFKSNTTCIKYSGYGVSMTTKLPRFNISIMQAAEKIYKTIIEGECRPFLSLQSKCNLHSST